MTRGRSSTYSVASMRPLNSSLSVTGRSTAGTTLTGAALGPPGGASAWLLHPDTANMASIAAATRPAPDRMELEKLRIVTITSSPFEYREHLVLRVLRRSAIGATVEAYLRRFTPAA